jgi:uncharacterized membrane protein YeaQ/YmgE (transglycosylase-associated protein family)
MQQTFIIIIGGIGGAVITFLLQKYGLSGVVASCIVGLIGALIGYLAKSTHLPLIIFAGSFVGMTSTAIGTIPMIIIGGALSGLLYKLSLNIFAGFGGRLGTIAFISTVISFYVLLAIKKILPAKMNK